MKRSLIVLFVGLGLAAVAWLGTVRAYFASLLLIAAAFGLAYLAVIHPRFYDELLTLFRAWFGHETYYDTQDDKKTEQRGRKRKRKQRPAARY